MSQQELDSCLVLLIMSSPARKRYSAEQIIGYLREAEVLLAKGSTIGQVCRKIGIPVKMEILT
jgi:hypothetical protein